MRRLWRANKIQGEYLDISRYIDDLKRGNDNVTGLPIPMEVSLPNRSDEGDLLKRKREMEEEQRAPPSKLAKSSAVEDTEDEHAITVDYIQKGSGEETNVDSEMEEAEERSEANESNERSETEEEVEEDSEATDGSLQSSDDGDKDATSSDD